MSRIEAIKAAQIAALADTGQDNPYELAVASVDNEGQGRAQRIKALQRLEAKGRGVDPYHIDTGKPVSVAGNDLAHYQAAMAADLASLKQLKTLAEKNAAKKSMIPAYMPMVQDYLDKGHDYPNDVAVQVMIWLLDTDDIEPGLALAFALIERNQHMPPHFDRRDIETFLCDAMYDWANGLLKKGESANPYLEMLADRVDYDRWSVHPAVASKIFVMLAKHKFEEKQYQAAVNWCDRANAVNPEGAGVKTLRQRAAEKL